jgi:hypothetical protein
VDEILRSIKMIGGRNIPGFLIFIISGLAISKIALFR